MNTLDRFTAKYTIQADGCWSWRAYTNVYGYGQISMGNKKIYAHRFSYEVYVGPIPCDLQIDHLCRNRACVNPDHLEAVTQQENIRRGKPGNKGIHEAMKTHCPQGHPYSGDNLYVVPKSGFRQCRTCHKVRQSIIKQTMADTLPLSGKEVIS